MALPLHIATLETVEEPFREHYIAVGNDGDGFRFDGTPVEGFTVERNIGVQTKTLEKERNQRRSAEDRLKRFELDGALPDPTDVHAALAKVDEMANWDPEKQVAEKIAAREAQLIKKHNEAIGTHETTNVRLRGQLQDRLVTQSATEALLAAGVNAKRLPVALPFIQSHVKLRDGDGETLMVEVIDEEGTPRVGDTAGNPMTIPQLVEEMKASETWDAIFDGTGSSGSDADGTQSTSGPPKAKPAGKVLVIPRSDQDMVDANFEKIATGEAVVDMDK